ncbi:hypothetical protein [Bradyrhizobium sp. dw_78]|uniref:hypothetical protein n=1 Tax=Bradyrhizobium sp. dw_78 TaxID=2719793 RepID=UPI001BD55FEB|nr:hypothetical protein [Bradyrhizobium sp. dw_78]
MNRHAFKRFRNIALPRAFRQIRLERARDHDHPKGDSEIAYVITAPLDAASRVDADLWKLHKEACRVARQRPVGNDQLGHIMHGPGGNWRFHYDVAGDLPDEAGHHLGDERFEPGEYVSIHEADGMHPYLVVAVTPL